MKPQLGLDHSRNPCACEELEYLSEIVAQNGGLKRYLREFAHATWITQWRDLLDSDGPGAFSRRCSLEISAERSLKSFYSDLAFTQKSSIGWQPFLQKIFKCDQCSSEFRAERIDCLPVHPLIEIISPLSNKVITLFLDSVDQLQPSLPRSAVNGLLDSLDQSLLEIMGAPLQFEIARAACGLGVLGREHRSNKIQLLKFWMEAYEIPEIFQRYPVMGRIVSERIEGWVASLSECLQRLSNDRALIAQHMGITEDEVVESVTTDLSDRHNGGKTVVSFCFSGGKSIIYKPRDLSLDLQFLRMCDWMNQRFGALELKAPRVLNRGEYGWVEFISHELCQSDDQLRLFYRRSGMLLGLLDLLNANDCHLENIVAQGAYPVLIDPETLFHSSVRLGRTHKNQGESQHDFASVLVNSVARLGYLPSWHRGPGTEILRDLSALGATQISISPQQTQIDTAVCEPTAIVKLQPKSSPISEGEFLPDFAPTEVVSGYEECRKVLRASQAELLGDSSPLNGFRGLKSRVVIRPTEEYGLVFERSLDIASLKSALQRSLAFELLARKVVAENIEDHWFMIFLSERRALERGDIPHFLMSIDSTSLTLPEGLEVPNVVARSAWECVRERVLALADERSCDLNQRIISQSLMMRTIATISIDDHDSGLIDQSAHVAMQDVLKIADTLSASALTLSDESKGWLFPALVHSSVEGKYCHTITRPDLYEGAAGIGLFFAALYSITKNDQHRDMALGGYGTLRSYARHLLDSNEFVPSGLGCGRGAILYALSSGARLLNDDSLLKLAHELFDLWWRKRSPVVDSIFDIVGGSAGDLLALLRLYRDGGYQDVLYQACALGDYLLFSGMETSEGQLAWQGASTRPLAGFAHGASGIGYALSELFRISRDSRYQVGANQAFAYEQSVYSPKHAGWPDLRDQKPGDTRSLFPSSWCHGGAGIGLARLGTLESLDRVENINEIEIAVNQARMHAANGPDQICCGALSRVELLIAAGRKLSRPELIDCGHKIANKVVARATRLGGYACLQRAPRAVQVPGLFNGLAGIGYQLLRLLEPDKIPSIHLFE